MRTRLSLAVFLVLAGSAWLTWATCVANPKARAATTLSGSGFCRYQVSIALRNSAC